MDNQNKNSLFDQYVDASVALFMEHYSSVLTDHVKTEIMSSESVDVSDGLDQKCRTLIRKEFAKRKRKAFLKGVSKGLSYAAVLMVALLSLSSALFITVEAVRVPIINFFIEQGDGYWVITGEDEDTSAHRDNQNKIVFDEADPLRDLLPEEFRLERYIELNTGATAMYADELGNNAVLVLTRNSSALMIDTENAEYTKEISILDCKAILVKTEKLSLVWLDSKRDVLYNLVVDSIDEEDLIEIAEEVTSRYRK